MSTDHQPPSGENSPKRSEAFIEQVTVALDHCADPHYLGIHSPLAAPYLLGSRLDALPNAGARAKPAERGAILVATMNEAAGNIVDAELRTLIQNRYLSRNQYLSNTGLALRTGVSERTFYRLRNRAIAAFSEQLYAVLVPPLRLESPAAPEIAGRSETLHALARAMQANHSIYISGPSGIGKTALAAAATQRDPQQRPRFWFTVRPGFNDHYAGFVFALAYFLHTRDAGNTWRQLIADGGRVNDERINALIRYDFSLLATNILIAVDEVDLLNAESIEHNRLLTLLDNLQEVSNGKALPVFVGQRVLLSTAISIALDGLTVQETDDWLKRNNLKGLSAAQHTQLTRLSGGSPLMLGLFAALVRSGEDVESVLLSFGNHPTLEAVLVRIWRRLTEEERTLLMRLAVFQVSAPADGWRGLEGAMQTLIERQLVSRTPNDLLALTPQLKPLIYGRIPAELRRRYHGEASIMLEARGNVTGAMRQALNAHDERRALSLWLQEREVQIARGQGSIALEILMQIAASDLPTSEEAAALRATRAELLLLQGRFEESEIDARAVGITGNDGFDAHVSGLLAIALDSQGSGDHAVGAYQNALALLVPPNEIARVALRKRLTTLLSRQRELVEARNNAFLARVDGYVAHGTLELLSGNLHKARDLFAAADAIVADGTDEGVTLPPAMRNELYTRMGTVALLLNDLDAGIAYMQRAFAANEEVGNLVEPLVGTANLAWALSVANRPHEALAIAQPALERAQRMRQPYLIAGLAAAAGEAAVALGQEEDAENLLMLSLQQEDEAMRPWALTAWGALRAQQERHAEAVRYLKEASELAGAIDDPHGVAYALLPLAQSQRALGLVEEARQSAQRAQELYVSLGMEAKVTEAGELLAELNRL